jgi:uncharacterized protein Yka (UPF0111/DUF47 family)
MKANKTVVQSFNNSPKWTMARLLGAFGIGAYPENSKQEFNAFMKASVEAHEKTKLAVENAQQSIEESNKILKNSAL